MGMSTGEWAAYLSHELGVGLPPAEVADLVIGRMAERYADKLPLLPGAEQAVRELAAGWPLGLASSSPPVLIDTVLRESGLSAAFAATMSTELVPRGKPAPDIYLAVAQRLGHPATASAAIEDSANGLRSAAAAGLTVIAVPHPRYPPGPEALGLATVVLDGLNGLTAEVIRGLD
jgi:HAD superfamily hydrolase (TIGR01509 family)